MNGVQSFEEYQREQHGGSPLSAPRGAGVPTERPNPVTARPERRPRRSPRGPRPPQPWYRNRNIYYMVLSVLLVAVLVLCFLPVSFGTVIVEGNTKLPTEEVYRMAQIGRPVNVLQLSTADIKTRLSGDLRVAHADVSREMPLTIRIRMVEREPLAIVNTDFGYAVLDAEGIVIAQMETIREVRAAFVTGDNFGNLVLGDRLREPVLLKALDFLAHLSTEGRQEMSEVNISDAHQIIAYTRDNLPIHLGAGDHMSEQAPLSENMLKDIRARKLDARFVDANIGAPYIKLK